MMHTDIGQKTSDRPPRKVLGRIGTPSVSAVKAAANCTPRGPFAAETCQTDKRATETTLLTAWLTGMAYWHTRAHV